ncbi:hypothetical protein [Streptomyces mirabilis]|uniref:hypothetical protein n=1 Tax=Streptomyces mirabilis TaxID=68239 RepID=UPI003F4BFA91
MLSAGSWGTAMAKVFADAGSDVTIHARRPEVVAEINVRHQNARYLPDSGSGTADRSTPVVCTSQSYVQVSAARAPASSSS